MEVGFPAEMASQMSVVEMCVSHSFGRSRDLAGIRHSFGRSGKSGRGRKATEGRATGVKAGGRAGSEGRREGWKGSEMCGYVVICG